MKYFSYGHYIMDFQFKDRKDHVDNINDINDLIAALNQVKRDYGNLPIGGVEEDKELFEGLHVYADKVLVINL